MEILKTFSHKTWRGPLAEGERRAALAALESGCVLFFPQLAFCLYPSEQCLLSPAISSGRAKNISLDPSGRLENAKLSRDRHRTLAAMMERFANHAQTFV